MLRTDWIDSHVHLWTPDTKRYPLAMGTDAAAVEPKNFSPEVLLRHARPSCVGRIVLVQTILYGTDNSYMLDAIERFPAVFRMVAIVDRNSERLAAEMADLRERGVTGFRIIAPPNGADGWLKDAGYNKMFKTAATNGQAICPLTPPDGLPDLDRMCGMYPDTAVVVDHMARVGEQGAVDDSQIGMLCALARHPNVYVKASRFHSLGARKPPHDDLLPLIRRVLDAFGPQRVMWGSDSPFQVLRETYEDSIAVIRDRLDLNDGDRWHVLAGTADKVFFDG